MISKLVLLLGIVIGLMGVNINAEPVSTNVSESTESEAPLEQSLEDLLNIKTSVASRKETGIRSTPGIVSIITDRDIRNMGATDLIDVLRTIPSFDFGTDVQGVVGLGVRGLWAHEGKFLLIIDGIELNEIQYGTNQFGNRHPVDQIKKIEVIRGPGSVIYGGFAELAVINITTKSGADLNGVRAQYTHGQMTQGSTRQNVSASYGMQRGNWQHSLSVSGGLARRGEGTYTGTDGTTSGSFDMKNADQLNPHYINAGLSNGALNLRFIYDEYKITSRSQYNWKDDDFSIPNEFRSMNFFGSYEFKLSDRLKITPNASYYLQNPWRQDSDAALNYYQIADVKSMRLKAGTLATYEPNQKLSLLAGYEYIRDRNVIDDRRNTTGHLPFQNNGDEFSLYSHALLSQAQYDSGFAIWTLGARYEDSSRTKASFVPRFAITKEETRWHSKFLYSNAFRSPVLYNLVYEPQIQPEHTETYELEGGHAVTDSTYFTANLFYTKIRDPIVYYFDTSDHYSNFGNIATKGMELTLRYKINAAKLTAAYSYYEVDTNHVQSYQVQGNSEALLGMPQQKLVLNGTYYLNQAQDLRINSTLILRDKVYAHTTNPATNSTAEDKLDPTLIANIYLSKENLFFKGFGGGLGINNLLNQRNTFVQPYTGAANHSPLPGPSRELFARAEYQWNF